MSVVQGMRSIAASASRQTISVVPIAFVILVGLALAPLGLAQVPLMIDYPNHLAGLYAIVHYKDDPLLAQYYYAHWQLIPNLGMELLLYPFARIVDIYLLGKTFIGLCVLLLVSGVFAVERAVYQRTTVWPLTAFLFVFANWMLIVATLNYAMGVGIALHGFAVYIGLRERPFLRFACSFAFCVLLFFVHLSAFGLYGLAIFSFEIWRLLSNRDWRRCAERMALMALPFVMVTPLFLLSTTRQYAGAAGTEWGGLPTKLEGLYSIFRMYRWQFDLPFAALVIAAAIWAFWTKRLRLHPLAWIMLGISTGVFVAMPDILLGSAGADRRLPIGVLFVVLGMCSLELREPTHRIWFASLLVAAMAYRMAAMAVVINTELVPATQQFQASFAEMEPGKKVLVTSDSTALSRLGYHKTMRIIHAPTLAIIERSAFVSKAFAQPGHQVLAAQRPYRHLVDTGLKKPVDTNELLTLEDKGQYYSTWKTEFDYVYVIYPSGLLNDPHLRLLYHGNPFFDMYKVVAR